MITELPKIIKYKGVKYTLTTEKENGMFNLYYLSNSNNKKEFGKMLELPSKRTKVNLILFSWFQNSEIEAFNSLLNLLSKTTFEEEINNII